MKALAFQCTPAARIAGPPSDFGELWHGTLCRDLCCLPRDAGKGRTWGTHPCARAGFRPSAAPMVRRPGVEPPCLALPLPVQLSVVWLTVDLLQWTRVRLEALMAASAPAVTDAAAPASAEYSQLQDGDGKQAEPTEQPQGDTHLTTAPDLHAMGKMFLGKSSRLAFDAAVVLHFISVLVGYALAGSLAYAQLFGILGHYTLVIPIYIAVYFLIIIFGGTAVQSIISTFTFAKVTLLFFMIAVVGLVGSSVHLEPTNDFAASMEPFLLGTVALGGVVNIMPVIFSRVPFNATGIWRFRAAVTGGVVLCWLTNLLWAFFVLEIVPQTDAQAIEDQVGHSQLRGIEVSLEKARRQGEISTVPVTQIIDHGFPQYSWVSTTVTVFIVLSVSVSFITMGTGLKHVLDGIGALLAARRPTRQRHLTCSCTPLPSQWPSGVVTPLEHRKALLSCRASRTTRHARTAHLRSPPTVPAQQLGKVTRLCTAVRRLLSLGLGRT